RLRERTGAEIAVVTLPTIGDRAPVDVAVAIGRAWGVGAAAEVGDPRRNAGIVMLLVPRRPDDPNSGHIFIATGQGLEGIVTDLQAGRVRDLMLPELRQGAYGPALLTGTRALAALIARGMGVVDSLIGPPQAPASDTGLPPTRLLLLALFLFVFFVFVIGPAVRGGGASGRRRRRGGYYWGGPGPWIGGGGFGGGFGGGGGGGFGGFGGFGGGGGFSGGGAGGRF
ncbi:MAG: TPM domain-containing protein, partial [Gemmatimonadota bacterium]